MENGPWKGPFFVTTVYGNHGGEECVIVGGEVRGRGATATIFVWCERLGKSRVCEVRREVLCQIYARGGRCELWHGLNGNERC